MISCHLARLMGERKLKISELARATGINRGTLTRLYYERTIRLDIADLDALCGFLNCQVGDLLTYEFSAEPQDKDRKG